MSVFVDPCEAIRAIEAALLPLIVTGDVESITIGCMFHGPSPRKSWRDSDGTPRTLPCIGCDPRAWADALRVEEPLPEPVEFDLSVPDCYQYRSGESVVQLILVSGPSIKMRVEAVE